MVFPEVEYVLYSELGVYILGDIKGERLFTDKTIKKYDLAYKKKIYTLEFNIEDIDPKFVPNINVLFHEQNGHVDFDEVLKHLTVNGISTKYITHFAPISHTENPNKIYMYIGNYNHNTIIVKHRDYGLFERMKTEATKFISDFKKKREELNGCAMVTTN